MIYCSRKFGGGLRKCTEPSTIVREGLVVAATSTIEWTDATWNPTTGCTKVSPGCDNCYAERFAERWRGVAGNYFTKGFDLTLRPNMLPRPAQWRGSKRIFVNSMSDLFHRDIPDEYIDRVFDVMEGVDRHIYQVLTKRPERMRRYLRKRYLGTTAPVQIWAGVSVESNAYAWRADMLRECPVSVRFLSMEPLIGSVDQVSINDLHWVIVGGESGPGRRPMAPSWVRDVRDRCVAQQIAFFFKQWHKAGTGRELDGRTWDEMPREARMTTAS
jgi:protein gp37